MEIVKQGSIDGVDWQLQRADESHVSASGPAALYFIVLRRPGHAWTTARPFDDTAVEEGEWDAAVEREARRRVRQLLDA
ncbi:MAG: hypothetical protein HYV19_04320 [Gemmatimonadetes bacterium]|nr:hypothetical protein [Gemmatimonadota bacterium]